MTTRDDAVNAAAKAIRKVDPDAVTFAVAAAAVKAVDPIIRADERKRIAPEIGEAATRGGFGRGMRAGLFEAERIARGGESDE